MSWVTASEALRRLPVKPQTLYAYVSRGRLASRPDPDRPGASLFDGNDIDALVKARNAGRKRKDIAAAAIQWGDGILETKVATVRNGRLVYRGTDALEWSRTASLEQTARLLRGMPHDGEVLDVPEPATAANLAASAAKGRAFAWLAMRAATDPPALNRSAEALSREADVLLAGFVRALSGVDAALPAHERLARGWGLGPQREGLIRRTLVLLADHELNPSTFAARIAASTGASLAACALAGMAVLTGPRHGEAAARAGDFLQAATRQRPHTVIADWREKAQALPGVGHQLYPEGDPRAAAILTALALPPAGRAAIAAAEAESGGKANVDMALAALGLYLNLPRDAPFVLFAAGRMAGWLAHAIEQALSGEAIRPRARYRSG